MKFTFGTLGTPKSVKPLSASGPSERLGFGGGGGRAPGDDLFVGRPAKPLTFGGAPEASGTARTLFGGGGNGAGPLDPISAFEAPIGLAVGANGVTPEVATWPLGTPAPGGSADVTETKPVQRDPKAGMLSSLRGVTAGLLGIMGAREADAAEAGGDQARVTPAVFGGGREAEGPGLGTILLIAGGAYLAWQAVK